MARQNSPSSRSTTPPPQKPPLAVAQQPDAPQGQPPKASPAPMPEAAPTRPESRPTAAPTHEQVAQRAYELFLARGSQHGHAQEDWVQAERELRHGKQ